MKDLALLIPRVVLGGLLAGHGAQKLFGAFGGYGLKGTAGWLESIGLRPGDRWAMLAGLGEFGGGVLTLLGLGGAVGPITAMAPMAMAAGTVHAGKPIWVTSGGPELPITNLAIAAAIAVGGPGRYSLDHAFGIEVPRAVTALALGATVAGVGVGLATASAYSKQQAVEKPHAVEAGAELEGGKEAAGPGGHES